MRSFSPAAPRRADCVIPATPAMRVVPVAFRYSPEVGAIDVGGHRLAERDRFRDVPAPQRPRSVEVGGGPVTLDAGAMAIREDFDDRVAFVTDLA